MYGVVYTNWSRTRYLRGTHPVPNLAYPDRVGDRLPVIVGSDGRPEVTLTAFMIDFRSHARSTLSQYADVLVRFANFLEATSGRRPWEAIPSDMSNYRLFRTYGQKESIGAYSFRPEASALRKYFQWLQRVEIRSDNPIVWQGRTGRDNLTVRAEAPSAIRYVPPQTYRLLLDAAAGSGRPHHQRRLDLRNAALIRTFISTGMRLREATNLLTVEVDRAPLSGSTRLVSIEAVAKYGKRRDVYVPQYALTAIERYQRIERPHHVASRQDHLRANLDSLFIVDAESLRGDAIRGAWGGVGSDIRYPMHRLPVECRAKAVTIGARGWIEPLGLFISGTHALPMTRSGWESVFATLSAEMIATGPPEHCRPVRPHDLRHTFAINYLKSRRNEISDTPTATVGPLYLRDPTYDLQRLMGHSSIASTINYLRYIDALGPTIESSIADYLEDR